jgi:hypothetical protein
MASGSGLTFVLIFTVSTPSSPEATKPHKEQSLKRLINIVLALRGEALGCKQENCINTSEDRI